ncbi:Bro-N domain-containing protein [Pseudomonas gingeri]|uniref:BRO-N domain-containing protein n=1 Tax=Pseudomonas gingeri TaxID=117681 RepID=UPI0015A3EACF|nr:Bro-N domain-containing protein [Pseudomonas gingeri]NVZ63879.1 Bro-N domain-containing protein [Pseudomonas gingeri]NVZ77975.1 Bro-N domain-containing protein [Pseudomonas gingeri]
MPKPTPNPPVISPDSCTHGPSGGVFKPTVFPRHNRFLNTLMLSNQAWFCIRDLARLMGRPLDERMTRKLDPDQHRYVSLLKAGLVTRCLMVSESGVYALLIHHYIPENRSLRQWLSNEVVPALRGGQPPQASNVPSLSTLQWAGMSVRLLHWQDEPWIKWRDMPDLLQPTERATGA